MNYFQLFQVPAQFDLDLTELGTRYLELQRNFHPDNFAAGSERDRLLAVQQAANINDAYHSLKQPLLRAEHLLALRGVKISHEQRSFTDTSFLMQQMELRELLGDILHSSDPYVLIDEAEQQIQQQKNVLLKLLAQALEANHHEQDLQAADIIRKLKFFFKLQHELELIEQQLQD
ncbi:Fe-S protein assembly co-chaperone HscB [Rheinheimera sp. SA_1]|jgi:molecular chaperone HscB|uniref:co-chaperone HscB n=1 Tax=Rheinheimera sp. SA_1 TaxID=1827365 RepID=UPI0007FBAED6|nr:co-chaperone HscB [Rheinheimera sp. SA_1]OBP14050.1 Fe-S protein assembly co-chaperone HscB [Rheinheimera sp. SA_1]